MKNSIIVYMALIFFVLLIQFSLADNDINNQEETAVTIILTHLDVNDTSLKFGWKIVNNTNDDVWICDSVDRPYTTSYEVFLTMDSHILSIRRRLDVQTGGIWRASPVGRYIRLRPGEIHPESLVLNLPVQSRFVYATPRLTKVKENARIIALEIGYYDKDLPKLVRNIIQEAEKLGDTNSALDPFVIEDYFKDYFRGFLVRDLLGPLDSFNAMNKDPYGEGKVLIPYSYQALTGEKVLQLLINDVSIPFEGDEMSITNVGKKAQYAQSQKKNSSNEEKPDLEDGSDQNTVAKD